MDNLNLLNETFNLYYNKAKECFDKDEKMLAKRYYMLAAEQMLKMAKESEGQLQKARLQRAKSILEFADNITVEKKRRCRVMAKRHLSLLKKVKKFRLTRLCIAFLSLKGLAE
jgi:hypothetical protein